MHRTKRPEWDSLLDHSSARRRKDSGTFSPIASPRGRTASEKRDEIVGREEPDFRLI
jgi:hypothetical protein